MKKCIYELIGRHREVGNQDDPQFDKAARYDWRRFVPDELQKVWKDMSVESRVMVKVFAEQVANNRMMEHD